jgi:UDP-3-O-[3-hydroxymyristoyl] glucosamine N-acyltransferase
MRYKLSEIAKELGLEFSGRDIEVDGVEDISLAQPSHISFFSDKKYIDALSTTKAGAVLIEQEYAHLLPSTSEAIITPEPYLMLAYLSKLFSHNLSAKLYPPTVGSGCDISSDIKCGKDVVIEDDVTILAGCYLGDGVVIKKGTLLHANVTIYHGCEIGEECIIHSGAVIGSDGYGFAHTKSGEHIKIYQNGNVVVEDRVEIGANSTIDRGAISSTYIRSGTKLDNLIHIAHNCDIGANTLCAAQVGIAGSTKLGRNVVMGGQSGSAGHIEIGDFVTVAANGGVTKSLPAGFNVYAGFPAIDIKLWRKMNATMMRLVKSRLKK